MTPLGNLNVDSHLREQLLSTKKFNIMKQEIDEKEHSGEMQYPYIQKIINDAMKENSGEEYSIKVLPIMVGSIGVSKEESMGKLLSPFLSDRGIFTVISSDFCHCKCRNVCMPHFVYEDLPFIYFVCVCVLTNHLVNDQKHMMHGVQGVDDSVIHLNQRKKTETLMQFVTTLNIWIERACS
jgi:AmmeMemoRadiSam system protein B